MLVGLVGFFIAPQKEVSISEIGVAVVGGAYRDRLFKNLNCVCIARVLNVSGPQVGKAKEPVRSEGPYLIEHLGSFPEAPMPIVKCPQPIVPSPIMGP